METRLTDKEQARCRTCGASHGGFISLSFEKPPLREALARARAFILECGSTPTRAEIYSIYRQARCPGGLIVYRMWLSP